MRITSLQLRRIKKLEQQLRTQRETNKLLEKENNDLNKMVALLKNQNQSILDNYENEFKELKAKREEYDELIKSIKAERKQYTKQIQKLFAKTKTITN